jgi:hypothetical protein
VAQDEGFGYAYSVPCLSGFVSLMEAVYTAEWRLLTTIEYLNMNPGKIRVFTSFLELVYGCGGAHAFFFRLPVSVFVARPGPPVAFACRVLCGHNSCEWGIM